MKAFPQEADCRAHLNPSPHYLLHPSNEKNYIFDGWTGDPRRRRSLAIICVLWWILWATTFSVPGLLGWRGGDSFFNGFSWWLHLTYLPSNNITVWNVTFVFRAGDLFLCSALFWAQTITLPLPSPMFKKFSFVYNACLFRRFCFRAKRVQSLATTPAKWVIRSPAHSTSCDPTPPLEPLNPCSVPSISFPLSFRAARRWLKLVYLHLSDTQTGCLAWWNPFYSELSY